LPLDSLILKEKLIQLFTSTYIAYDSRIPKIITTIIAPIIAFFKPVSFGNPLFFS